MSHHMEARGVSAVDGTTAAKVERAALFLFAHKGIDGVSIKEIAARAGVSEGVIYRYFPSKQALAESLMKAIHIRLTDLVRISSRRDLTFAQKLRGLIAHYCAIADEDWILFRYHLLHVHAFVGLTREVGDGPVDAAVSMVKDAMDKGEIPKANPEVVAAMALGTILQVAQSKIYDRIEGKLSDHKALFEKAIFALLGLSSDQGELTQEG